MDFTNGCFSMNKNVKTPNYNKYVSTVPNESFSIKKVQQGQKMKEEEHA